MKKKLLIILSMVLTLPFVALGGVWVAAKQGHVDAQRSLFLFYSINIVRNDTNAVYWVKQAAEQGDGLLQNVLGNVYANGEAGVSKDDVEATRWYTLSATQGNSIGQNNLAVMYKTGLGVKKDIAEAVRWYNLSAMQGDPFGQFNLGVLYEQGKELPKDERQAARWYSLAATQDFKRSQTYLDESYVGRFIMLIGGQGLTLAEVGNQGGAYRLALMYEEGRGVEQNTIEAIRFYKLAAKQGHLRSQQALQRLNAK
jgi:TPR repeat protein